MRDYTVVPLLKDYPSCNEKVVLLKEWPLLMGKFSRIYFSSTSEIYPDKRGVL
jgi:hypothetical protein